MNSADYPDLFLPAYNQYEPLSPGAQESAPWSTSAADPAEPEPAAPVDQGPQGIPGAGPSFLVDQGPQGILDAELTPVQLDRQGSLSTGYGIKFFPLHYRLFP